MKLLVSVAAMSAALAVGAGAHAENLVTNGDFSDLKNGTGQIDKYTRAADWDGGHGYNFIFSDADVVAKGDFGGITLWDDTMLGVAPSNTWDGTAPGGSNFAALDGDPGSPALTQKINGLVAGDTYDLTFDYAFAQQAGFSGDTVQFLTASMKNATATDLDFTTPDVDVVSHGFSGWNEVTEQFTATSTSDILSFLAGSSGGDPPYALLTNISISPAPEPAVWALMVLGLGGAGFAIRRRRRTAAAASGAV